LISDYWSCCCGPGNRVAGAASLLSNHSSSHETEKRADIEATSLSLNSQNVETGQPVVGTVGMKETGLPMGS
jgi:hypothetical protein